MAAWDTDVRWDKYLNADLAVIAYTQLRKEILRVRPLPGAARGG